MVMRGLVSLKSVLHLKLLKKVMFIETQTVKSHVTQVVCFSSSASRSRV